MRIEFKIDPSDPSDPLDVDPVGNISLISGDQILVEKDVYLDSWLNAILEGATKIATANSVEVDLIEERDPLVFERKNLGVRIGYRNKSITVPSVNELMNAVEKGIQAFALVSPNKRNT